MMGGEWKSAFSDADLENGLELALTGAVSVLDDAPETVIASIKDADVTYRVFVRLKKGWPHVYCGCEIGRMGNTCAHAAAALFVHDGVRPETTVADKKKAAKNAVAKTTAVKKKAASTEEKKQPKPVYVPSKELFCPVKTDDDGDFRSNYQYFHLDVITKDLLFRKDVVEKARELVEADGVFLRNIQVGFATAGSDAIAEAAGGAVYGKTEYFVGCEFGRTRVFWMNCMVPECRKKYAAAAGNGAKSPCPHCTALLMRVYDNIGRGDFIVDASNSEGIHFLDAFKDKIRKDVAKGSDAVKDVVIEPRLEYDGWDLELGFRIGIDKMYVVKGIRQLVDTIENKGVLKLGKKTEISFVLHALTEESERYFALMREYVEELEFGYKDSFYSPGERSTIPLHGRILDTCYDMLFGHTVAFKGYYEKEKPIAVGESDYRPKLSLSAMGKNKKSFEGIRLSGRVPNMIEGIGRYYILTDKMLGHVSDRLADILLPFVKSGEYEDSNICIGRKHLGEFYNDILPRLGEYCDIEMHDEALIAPFVPPDAEFTFYLDAPEGNITMRAQVAYEDTVFPLLPKEEKADAFRDHISEAQVRSLVQELFPEYDEKAGEYSAQADADTVYHILEYGVGELMSNGIVEATDRFLRLKINRSMKINLGISLSANLLTLDVSSDELSHEELLELLYSYRA
ncbi:MAG: SNF2 helicase associated domain-containing protein, partial [Lachnospiraceae bacterium]|nr:SNF2 helicase associated domain-containing protein [Lachnospiraceae bacterium]